jgi:Toprim domain
MSALPSPAAELARLLSEKAEAVCRHYLSNGRRCGHYWTVGDVGNTPGRSLYVRLRGPSSGKGAAGKWCDAATGEHGDLVDLIRLNCGFESLRETLDEARSFLRVPRPEPQPRTRREPARRSSRQAARRLFGMGRSVIGTPAEAYLRARGITAPLNELCSLRFHPGCYYRAADTGSRETWPALLAAITDLRGNVTAVQRTWLARYGARKAPIEDPRRSLGHQLGSGVRLGLIDDVLTVGEGLETMLSLRSVLPQMPMLAGLSANHLAALELPFGLRRLYVARDNDAEGRRAETRLRERIESQGVDVCALQPAYADFNVDLRRFGPGALRERIARQLVPEDRERFAVSQADPGRLMVRPLRDSRGCPQSSSDGLLVGSGERRARPS